MQNVASHKLNPRNYKAEYPSWEYARVWHMNETARKMSTTTLIFAIQKLAVDELPAAMTGDGSHSVLICLENPKGYRQSTNLCRICYYGDPNPEEGYTSFRVLWGKRGHDTWRDMTRDDWWNIIEDWKKRR